MQARDVMTLNVISVSEESPIHEIVRLLLKFRISAVPVVDSGRKVVGMISESDLLRPEGVNRTGTQRRWWLETVFAGQTLRYEQAHGRTAAGQFLQSRARVRGIAKTAGADPLGALPEVGELGALVVILGRKMSAHGAV